MFIALLNYLSDPSTTQQLNLLSRDIRVAFVVGTIIFTSVSATIVGVQMRRKIRRDLGRKATDLDLTSIDTWMKVDEAEERNQAKKPLG